MKDWFNLIIAMGVMSYFLFSLMVKATSQELEEIRAQLKVVITKLEDIQNRVE